MAKKSKSAAAENAGPDVLFLRIDPELAQWLASLSESTGKSRNELAGGALAEFREAVKLADEIKAGIPKGYVPDDYVAVLGASWVQRLIAMGLSDDLMRFVWRHYLATAECERQELRREIEEQRKGKK